MPAKTTTAKTPTRVEQELDVVGLKFRWKREARRALSDMIRKRGAITGVRIIREPENKYDANALAVYLPTRIMDGKQLGYLRASSAVILAPHVDAGAVKLVSAKLLNLDAEDDWNSGTLLVVLRKVKPRG